MREDVARILKMVEEGKISSEKAGELIEALNTANGVNTENAQMSTPNSFINNSDKMLKVRVISNDDVVNINLPIKFVKAIGGSAKAIPGMKDVEGVDFEAILQAIDNDIEGKIVDIKSSNGEIVEVSIE